MREYLHMGQRTGEVGPVVEELRDWLFFNWWRNRTAVWTERGLWFDLLIKVPFFIYCLFDCPDPQVFQVYRKIQTFTKKGFTQLSRVRVSEQKKRIEYPSQILLSCKMIGSDLVMCIDSLLDPSPSRCESGLCCALGSSRREDQTWRYLSHPTPECICPSVY